MKKVLTIQDLSCIGKCSLTVAIPIISSMGIETVALPTALLSNHTAFKSFTFCALDDNIMDIVEKWQELGVSFDAIYTGYLGSIDQIKMVKKIIKTFDNGNTLKIVDPCLADNGVLYKGFTEDFAKSMATLCSLADVILPNMSEASFMTGVGYKGEEVSKKYVGILLRALGALGAKNVVLKSVHLKEQNASIGVVSCDNKHGKVKGYFHKRLPQNFHGTGDIFASVFTGALVNGLSIKKAYTLAADYVVRCIEATVANKAHNWYGVDFEGQLGWLSRKAKCNKE